MKNIAWTKEKVINIAKGDSEFKLDWRDKLQPDEAKPSLVPKKTLSKNSLHEATEADDKLLNEKIEDQIVNLRKNTEG